MAEGGSYSYDTNAAVEAQDRVEQAASNLQTSIQELSDHVKSLASTWEGNEHAEYVQVQAKVDDGHEAITQILSQLHGTLSENSNLVGSMRKKVTGQITGQA